MSQQGYIGRNPGDGRTIVNRQTTHVTTGVQTSFTMTVGYEVGYLDVYLNGIKQTETLDYTASDGSTINFGLSFPPVNGDVLEFVAFETLNISNIKSARRNFSVGQDLDVSGKVTIGSSLTVASDLVVNGTFTTINTEILDVEDKTVGIASTSSPSNTTADGAGIVIYGGSDGDKSLTWNTEKSNFVLVGGGVSIGTGVTISTPANNVLAFSVNSAEKARFNNFGAFTVGYEGEAWHESTYVGVLQAGSGAWIGQTPGASARAEWVNNAYYDSVNTRWEYIAADEANRIVLENGELKVQSANAGSADGAITWNEKLKMTVGGDFKIGAPTGIGITISSSGNVDSIGIVTASSFVGNGANLTSLNASNIGSGTVPTARLGSGTASSSTFLRGDSTFAAVTSTTINSNANNRVITGSDSADTLNGNSDLLWNGSRLDIDTGGTADALRIGNSSGADTFIRLGSTSTATDTHAVLKYDIDDNYVSLLVSGESHGSGGILIANGGAVSLSAGTSPSAKLHVKDDIYVKGSSGDGSVGIQIRSGSSAISGQHEVRTGGGLGNMLILNAAGATGLLQVQTNGTEKLRIDSSGHMGLGVVPSAWPTNGDYTGLQVGSGACIFGRGSGDEDRGGIGVNYYGTTSGAKYITNGHGCRIYMADGNISLQNAASNSSGAGAAMTLNTRVNVDATDGHVDFTGSTSSTLGYTFQNGTSGSSADVRVLIKSYANSGADPYIKFDAGGSDMVVGTSYQGTTNNTLCLGPGNSPSTNNDGLTINGIGKATLRAHLTGQEPILTIINDRTRTSGHMYGLDFRDSSNESNANIVVRQGSNGNNVASMRFYINGGTGGNGLTNGIFCAQFTQSGHFIPGVNNTNDLGSSSYRWRNVYTTDLQLSNEGKTNDVDGTWGNYTIQEGESDLFLINNRSGKKYKFNLTEVS